MGLLLRQIILASGDAVLCYLSVILALVLRGRGSVFLDFQQEYVLTFSPVFAAWLLSLYAMGLYDFRRMWNLQTVIRESLLATAVDAALAVGVFYVLSPYDWLTPKTNLLMIVLFSHAGFCLWRHLWVRVLSVRLLVQKVAFLGQNPLIRAMLNELQDQPQLGWRAVDCPRLRDEERAPGAQFNPFLAKAPGGCEADLLVVDEALARSELPSFRKALDVSLAYGIPMFTDMQFYETVYRKIPPHAAARLDGLLPYMLSREKRALFMVKRLVDLAVAAAALPALAPAMAALASVSWACGLRPPLYSQKRLGYLGKEFRIWKFRTMVEGADKKGPLWAMPKEDARVTKWGRFLRRFRLDELPQLWNVLKGDMSLIGPRPEWVEEVRVLEKTVPHYHLRHLVKPGITGWAQVNFRATNSPDGSVEKLHYDLYYVKNISLSLDIGILLKTFKRVFLEDDSFGPVRKGSSPASAELGIAR